MIKHIFSDMDGTILDARGHVTPATARAFIAAGIPLTLVSARGPLEMLEAIDTLELHAAQVGFNGGLIFTTDGQTITPLYSAPLPTTPALTLMTDLRAAFPALTVTCYSADTWFSERIDAGIYTETAVTKLMPTLVDFQTLTTETLYKIMLITQTDAEMAALNTFIAGQNLDTSFSAKQSGRQYLEITSSAAKKSHGIEFIEAREHLNRADTLAFGDGHNDLPMFATVGHHIVMANALPEIKIGADHIAPSNLDDGVAFALDHIAEWYA